MAFPTISAQQELQTKKILEDLQHKKKLLIQSNSNNSMPQYNSQTTVVANTDVANNSSPARTALTQAQAQSSGFFVAQDSSFGNLFLPVLPRFDNPNPK